MSFMDRSLEVEGLSADLSGQPLRGLKLVIQVPCFNEEATLARVLADMPSEIEGVSAIEIQIIDDGSSDRTVEVARENGVHHIVRNVANKGLAHSFQAGINNAIANGADIIVNTDGDHQYPGCYIADLVRPIVEGRADVVVGDRRPGDNPEFSALKRFLQRFGTRVVRYLSEPDPKVVEQYQHLVIQPSLSRRWRKRWDGLVLLATNITGKVCDIQAI